MKALTVDEIKAMPVGEWVWIVFPERQESNGYYVKHSNNRYYTSCNFILVDYVYEHNYGKTWIAYKNKEQADCKGIIKEFPCNVGDTLYIFYWASFKAESPQILTVRVDELSYDTPEPLNYLVCCTCIENPALDDCCYGKHDFGEIVFTSYEEAENKLKGIKANGNKG